MFIFISSGINFFVETLKCINEFLKVGIIYFILKTAYEERIHKTKKYLHLVFLNILFDECRFI